MKKLFVILFIATTLFSCSSDDNAPSKVLQKVVFYRNTPQERQWIISNGLLTKITLADGTLAEEFTYDSSKRLISDTKYENGVISGTDVITYDNEGIIETINNLPYRFDAATRTYRYTYGTSFELTAQMNSDMLVMNYVRTGTRSGEYQFTYNNGDMTSFKKMSAGNPDQIKNFHFSGTNSNQSEMYNAVLAVAKVKSLTDPDFFIDCQVSKHSPEGFDKGPEVPYYFNYGLVPDTDNKSYHISIEVLDSNQNPVDVYTFADYYYY